MKKRQDKIIELIKSYEIDTQSELTDRLKDEGYDVTQSTVSRDIRKLKLTKFIDENGRSRYVIPHMKSEEEIVSHLKAKYINVLNESIVGMSESGTILVIKTLTGMAMAAATAIDSLKIKGITGCIAGDDTIFCAVSSGSDIMTVRETINGLMSK